MLRARNLLLASGLVRLMRVGTVAGVNRTRLTRLLFVYANHLQAKSEGKGEVCWIDSPTSGYADDAER